MALTSSGCLFSAVVDMLNALSFSSHRNGLARETTCDDIYRREFRSTKTGNISVVDYLRQSFCSHTNWEWFNFTVPDRLDSCKQPSQFKTPGTCKEAAEGQGLILFCTHSATSSPSICSLAFW